jgi:UDP-2-acetamido-2,6-beta-L-arabino-hexul-4-ose reductase
MSDVGQEAPLSRIGITGADGFLGWHLRCRLLIAGYPVPLLAGRETFADEAALRRFVEDSDAIIHLAGVNRAASDDEVVAGNAMLAASLGQALKSATRPRPLVYANSIKSLDGGPYGDAKAAAASALANAQAEVGGSFVDVLLPHLFGEFGRPFYNSAVTTFGHQLAVGETPVVDNDSTLELSHAQDSSAHLLELLSTERSGQHRLDGRKIQVSDALKMLKRHFERYIGQVTIPPFADRFEQQMFNLLRSQLFANGIRSFPITRHSDDRGFFSELIRNDGLGQSSISASVPGITRGDHFHVDKIERFLVVHGEARLRIRRLFTDEVHVLDVSGLEPVAVDMPPLCTHNITNTGTGEMLTFFWAADHFDPAHPDTFVEPVESARRKDQPKDRGQNS